MEINWIIIIGIVYFLGMIFIGTRFCCFCGDHSGSDLVSLLFWFIVAPYNYLKKEKKTKMKYSHIINDGVSKK